MSEQSSLKKGQENIQSLQENVKREVATARRPWYHIPRTLGVLLIIYSIQLALFAALAWWVHLYPVNPIDIAITREFQEDQAPWLRTSMIIISYPGNAWYILLALVVLAASIFWFAGLRLEATFTVGLSLVSLILNNLLKIWIGRIRPSSQLVEVLQTASGKSFPSGHVMAYVAFWGLLFSFGIILFKDLRWWRVLLLVVSGLFVILVGPSRVYLGDHWASDVLGAYLIGGLLLGIALYIYLQLKKRGVLEIDPPKLTFHFPGF